MGGVFLWPFRRLAAPRRYLAACPVELGLSSARPKAGRDRRALPLPAPKIAAPARSGQGTPGRGLHGRATALTTAKCALIRG